MPKNIFIKKFMPLCMLLSALAACGGNDANNTTASKAAISTAAATTTVGAGSTETTVSPAGTTTTGGSAVTAGGSIGGGTTTSANTSVGTTPAGTHAATSTSATGTTAAPGTTAVVSTTGAAGNTPTTTATATSGTPTGGTIPVTVTVPVTVPATSTTPAPSTGGTWNKKTVFNIVNGTHGRYPDAQVYWAIIGRDSTTGKFIHVDLNGAFIPMDVADNGALTKNGAGYTNYFHSIAQGGSVTIPPLDSARLFLSVGSPMYIKVNKDLDGNIGYAGANIENPADPNIDVIFDFVEMAIVPNAGFFGNTTRVDQFGFPVLLRLQGLNGYDQTVGETETRDALYSQYLASVPAEFRGLAQGPNAAYRIIAPAHASFNNGGANAAYLDGYIGDLWNKYRTQKLTFTNQQGTFSGQVSGDTFVFTDAAGTYKVEKPDTAMALLGAGTLADATGTVGGTPAYDKQLQIQAQLCAAINRHIVEDPANWSNADAYYKGGPANYFAKFWHDHSVNRLAYGFAYDDVWEKSSSLHTVAPTIATVTVGW